ncbi:hypothetical protein Glove_21g49 [Diversispora epigaea]|uniref:AAA+ ATPase domain-containing protein n=1 Tax=Diversispora epigaea TaxID=1348612 RepID=A0A397JKH8_9GLOM|nr:hypothetical protein Glove_21g49 [Diversispora epigaea]
MASASSSRWREDNNDKNSSSQDKSFPEINTSGNFYVTSVFHVHLPHEITEDNFIPVVTGNCESLGNFNKAQPTVTLKNQHNSTLWISDPVNIPLNVDVTYEYAYAVFRKENSRKYVLDTFEGSFSGTNRQMVLRANHYDIWQSRDNKYRINHEKLKRDFRFINCIYDSITELNFKEKLIEFQTVSHEHRDYVYNVVNLDYIRNKILESESRAKNCVMFILLGYYMERPNKHLFENNYLSTSFPSDKLLNVLNYLEPITGTKQYIMLSLRAVIQHSSSCGSLAWLKMFELAPKLDEDYTFLEYIINFDHSKNFHSFAQSLLDNVKPHISNLHFKVEIFRRVVQKLLDLSFDLECLIFISKDVIGFERFENSNGLQRYLKRRISEAIKQYSPHDLCMQFQKIPQNLKFGTIGLFLERLLKLLQPKDISWNDRDRESLIKFIKEPYPDWPEGMLLNVIDGIVRSDQILLLQSFPEILELALEKDIHRSVSKELYSTSENWLRNIVTVLSSKNKKKQANNIAYTTFQNFSLIYPIVKNRISTCAELKKIVDYILTPLSEDLIFSIAPYIGEFDPAVIEIYCAWIKIRLDQNLRDADEQLLQKIMQICDSKNKLNIKNRLCEEILCHIFDRLQISAKRKLYINDVDNLDNLQLSLLQASNFWKTIFLATGNTQKIHSHPYVEESRDIAITLAQSIASNKITLGLMQEIIKYVSKDYSILIEFVNSAVNDKAELEITQEIIENLSQQCIHNTTTYLRLEKFYNRFCSFQKITDSQKYIGDLQRRGALMNNYTIEELNSPEHWSIHMDAIIATDSFFHLSESHTFYNIFEATLENRELDVYTVIKEIIKIAIETYTEIILIEFVNSAVNDKAELEITQEIIENLSQQCIHNTTTYLRLEKFYNRFCSFQKITDSQKYIGDLQRRGALMNNYTIEELNSPEHWSIHMDAIIATDSFFHLSESHTFYNIFEATLENRELDVYTVIKEIIKIAIETYTEMCQGYKNWENIKYLEAKPFWDKVDAKKVEAEVAFLLPNCDRFKDLSEKRKRDESKNLVITIQNLVQVDEHIFRLEQLNTMLKETWKFQLDPKFWTNKILQDLKNENLTLTNLNKVSKELKRYINNYHLTKEVCDVIKEIASAPGFIDFLKTVRDDLKILINGVDDHSDESLMQADTVSACIQVKSILEPLFEYFSHVFELFWPKFIGVVKPNPFLSGKINLCNVNYQALKNMYENISRRGEITKQRINNCVTKGKYDFMRAENEQKCVARLSYSTNTPDNKVAEYSFADLQDLRGRAILISKAPVTSKVSEDEDHGSDEITAASMNEFVIQVDLCHQITNVASKLIERHFTYRKFFVTTTSTKEMTHLLELLTADLQKWEGIVDEAQEQFYYLTFYPARHILNFYDYFFEKETNMEVTNQCGKLLRFVNEKASLPPPELLKLDISLKVNNFFDIMSMIGTILFDIFSKTPVQRRKISSTVERITSNVVKPGQLFVASCNDEFRVPNIIMSLYANYEYYPEPWQLLICNATTTADDLLIFTKRCFFAERNGYDKYLFCIANVEILDFELQYQLVNSIRSLYQKEKIFHLALICCRKNGEHHHILEQFNQDVHFITTGLETESMSMIYKELAPNVTCVSSDLSGQGKTELIKDYSSEKKLIPRSLSISDSVQFGKLVQKLSELKLQKFESLHLNIALINYPYDVNMFLFELLSLGIVSNGIDIAFIPQTPVFIEVASTMNQYLLNSLPITGYLEKKHLSWNINKLIVSQQFNSPIQVVSRYLDEYDNGLLDENNISFAEPEAIDTLISQKRSRQLIHKYFFNEQPKDVTSYRFLEIFLDVLADQLVRMSNRTFFRVEVLKSMVTEQGIRSTLLDALLGISKEFATRSFDSKEEQKKNLSETEKAKLGAIKPWEESNHLLVVFLSQSPDSICALYRDKKLVPENVEGLLKSQHSGTKNFSLEDYEKMTPEDILKKLESLARTTNDRRGYYKYALSVENLLKMALILLRARANIPVVVCGEAGCGKTSLIQFLAYVINVKFEALNLHAGISEGNILEFMEKGEELAEQGQVWLFFDEINTCNHIGLLGELIAHRILDGKQIHPNIRIFAACNPYRIRTKSQSEAGLGSKVNKNLKNLVYQVHPLPDQILDYVWDYGVLRPADERIYIDFMVKKSLKDTIKDQGSKLLSALLFRSQEFIRGVEGKHSVSLRDVKRALNFVSFFITSLKRRRSYRWQYSYGYDFIDDFARSFLSSLYLCYQTRLYDRELRTKYCENICAVYNENRNDRLTVERFKKIIREEQQDFMNRMVKPPQTAENEALLENVLVIIVCILTKIPVFIIGASGASKSLAMRLVSQNLRGADSNDPYFRDLPQVYVIPYQGSTSSTSDGIEKVFRKAKDYQNTNSKEFPLITVILLEVGLAETSPHNPLKVLHYLLEPRYPEEFPNVSVIGISNWRLDNSKSSRALLVQRPKFEEKDLIDTAERLMSENNILSRFLSLSLTPKLRSLAESFLEYEKVQPIKNFHGLRDYYSLVKSLSASDMSLIATQMALARNFGGTNQMDQLWENHFKGVITAFHGQQMQYEKFLVEDLIKANLEDKGSRHLMVIGKSDSIVNLLTYKLRQWGKEFAEKQNESIGSSAWDMEPVVIYGSQFPNDVDGVDGDYQYGVLSRIMMCVEAGRPLILTELDIIYGSLYDLWNQNYIIVGRDDNQKFYTRVALGAYSNPMVLVHDNFRCILVLDEKNVNFADPLLLNRFEKQKMSTNDTLDDRMKRLVKILADWCKEISCFVEKGNTSKSEFKEHDMFIGFDHEETLQSLVIHNFSNSEADDEEKILLKCKEMLINIASSDGIVRSRNSRLSIDFEEVNQWKDIYFHEQFHDDLAAYVQSLLVKDTEDEGFKIIVNTFSNINTDVESCLDGILTCQVDKILTFKSEAQLTARIKQFFESEKRLFILQCDLSNVKPGCVKLAKFIIEQLRKEYMISNEFSEVLKPIKHACIILHVRRENKETSGSFNFMCGWNIVTVENLIPQERPLSSYLDNSFENILDTIYPFKEIMIEEIFWCLLCMRFPSTSESVNYIKMLSQEIPRHNEFLECLKIRSLEWIQQNISEDWLLQVASNKTNLYLYSSFSTSIQTYIRTQIRKPIAKLLCVLESLSGLSPLFFNDDLNNFGDLYEDFNNSNNLFELWKQLFMNTKIVNMGYLFDPKPDIYPMPAKNHNLKFPFSPYFMMQIDKFKKLYQEDLAILKENKDNCDEDTGELNQEIVEDCIERFTANIYNAVPSLKLPRFFEASEFYFRDFIVSVLPGFERNEREFELLKWIILYHLNQKIPNPIRLHTFWWKSSEAMLAELQLAVMCPEIIKTIMSLKNEEIVGFNFEAYILETVIDTMMERIGSVNFNQSEERVTSYVHEWQLDATNILSLSNKLSKDYSENTSLRRLRIYNDLSKSLELQDLLFIINQKP